MGFEIKKRYPDKIYGRTGCKGDRYPRQHYKYRKGYFLRLLTSELRYTCRPCDRLKAICSDPHMYVRSFHL